MVRKGEREASCCSQRDIRPAGILQFFHLLHSILSPLVEVLSSVAPSLEESFCGGECEHDAGVLPYVNQLRISPDMQFVCSSSNHHF